MLSLSLTVTDLRAKVTFGEQVKTPMIRPNFGRWRWSSDNPKPSWNAIKSAPVWRDPMYSSIRTALSKPPVTVSASNTGDQALRQLLFKLPNQPEQSRTLTIYDATEGTIPPGLVSVVPRAAVILLDGTDLMVSQITANAENIPMMAFGAVQHCSRMRDIILHNCPSRIVHTVWVYVRPRLVNPSERNKLMDYNLLLIGDEGSLKFQVCQLETALPDARVFSVSFVSSPGFFFGMCVFLLFMRGLA